MASEIAKEIVVDLGIFPLSIVKSALYVLGDRIDGRIGEEAYGKITLTLPYRRGSGFCRDGTRPQPSPDRGQRQ